MEFFEIKANVLKLKDEQIYAVTEFENLYNADTTKDKSRSFQYFRFLYLYCDYKSPFSDFEDKERFKKSLERADLTRDEVDNDLIKNCIKVYQEIENSNPIIQAISGTKKLLDKIQIYINEVDFTEKIESGPQKGKLVHSIAEARKTIIEMPRIVSELKKLLDVYKEELQGKVNYRKNTEASIWSNVE